MTAEPDPCIWPDWWPAHGSPRACHEGYCRRCEMEQQHGEGHEGEPCPWALEDAIDAMGVMIEDRDAMINRVRALHVRSTTQNVCRQDRKVWPCPTVRAITP